MASLEEKKTTITETTDTDTSGNVEGFKEADLEGQIEKNERAEPAPEEIYARKLTDALKQVSQSLEAEKIAALQTSLKGNEPTESATPEPVASLKSLTLAAAEKPRGFVAFLKEKARNFSLKRNGVRDPEQFSVFADFIEHHFTQEKSRTIVVSTAEAESVREKLIKEGKTVKLIYKKYSDETKTEIDYTEEIPFKVEKKDIKNLDALLGKVNDPLETIESLRRLGFGIEGHTFRYEADLLREFLEKPHILEALDKLQRLGVVRRSRYFGRTKSGSLFSEYPVEEIEKISNNEVFLSELNDETIVAVRSIIDETKMEVPLRMERLEALVSAAKDPEMKKVIMEIGRRNPLKLQYHSKNLFSLLQELKKKKVLGELANLSDVVGIHTLFPGGVLSHREVLESDEDVAKAVAQIRESVSADNLQKILKNRKEGEYVRQVAALTHLRFTPEMIDELLKFGGSSLDARKESLVILSAMNTAATDINDYNLKEYLGTVGGILSDKRMMERYVDPSFHDFLRHLYKATGAEISHYDFRVNRGSSRILDLHDDEPTRELILSERGQRLIRSVGAFSISEASKYKALAQVEGIPEVIDQLRTVYGYDARNSWQLSEDKLTRLAEDPNLRENLFNEKTVGFFNRLRNDFEVKFDIHEVDNLLAMANDTHFVAKLYASENVEFVRLQGTHSIARLKLLTEVQEDLKPTLFNLKKNYKYSANFDYGAQVLADKDILSALSADEGLKEKFFDKATVQRVNRLQGCGYYGKKIPDLMKLGDVPDDTVTFVEELHRRGLYNFEPHDLPMIEKCKNTEHLVDLFSTLKQFGFKFEMPKLDSVGVLTKYEPSTVASKLQLLRDMESDYKFSTDDTTSVVTLIEKDLGPEDLKALDILQKKHQGQDTTFNTSLIPRLVFLKEHEEVIVTTKEQLEKCGISFVRYPFIEYMNPVFGGETFKKIHDNNILPQFQAHQGNTEMQLFLFKNVDRIAAIKPEKRNDFIKLVLAIKESPSQEIKRMESQLVEQLLQTENPTTLYKKVEDIFVKNNLPTVGKVYKVFETLYSPQKLKNDIEAHGGSPLLKKAGARKRSYMIYQDLLRTHIRSGNRSLRAYAEVLRDGEGVLNEAEEAGPDKLDASKQEQLRYLLGKLNTLFVNSMFGRNLHGEVVEQDLDLKAELKRLRRDLQVKEGQSITSRITEMYLRPIGLQSINDLLEEMQNAKKIAHERGLRYAAEAENGALQLQAGDLLKGINHQFVETILQNGSVSKEFLGASSTQDMTPFDTDVSLVESGDLDDGFEGAVNKSMAVGYGTVLFAVRNRGQFNITRQNRAENLEVADDSKLELFETGGGKHYGIRTGFPTTEIDYILVKDEMFNTGEGRKTFDNLCFEIAQNGYYIPVTDTRGAVIFTPDQYQELRKIFNGLERFDGADFNFVDTMPTDRSQKDITDVLRQKRGEEHSMAAMMAQIRSGVERILKKRAIKLLSKYDTGIVGAELVETGSIGRQTNLGGDFDFDFALKLDAKDFPKAGEIAADLKKAMVMEKDNSHAETSGYYQLRAEGVTQIGDIVFDSPINIDIGLADRSELSIFDTQDALAERYDWVQSRLGKDAHEKVLANVILAKQILKEAKAYKKFEHGGLGGVGVENWILANGGSIIEALKSFLRAAKKDDGELTSLNEFKENYKIIDPGVNIKEHRHDNFVYKLTEEGYAAMIKAIETYLAA